MTTETQTPTQDVTPPAEKAATPAATAPAKAEPKKAAAPAKKAVTKKPAARKTAASKTTRPGKSAKPKAKVKTAKPAAAKAKAAGKKASKPTAPAFSEDYTKEMKTMYENSMKQMQDMMSEFKGGMADFPIANEEVGKVVEASREATISGMTELNKELNKFTQARMTECWETTREVLGSKSMPEAFEVQSKYFQDVMKAYTEEFQKLNSLATDVTQKAFAPMNNGFTDSFTKMFTGK